MPETGKTIRRQWRQAGDLQGEAEDEIHNKAPTGQMQRPFHPKLPVAQNQ